MKENFVKPVLIGNALWVNQTLQVHFKNSTNYSEVRFETQLLSKERNDERNIPFKLTHTSNTNKHSSTNNSCHLQGRSNSPCSCFVLSIVWHAIRHSCSSGDGINPADPPAASWRACHQWWSSLLIICNAEQSVSMNHWINSHTR